jgi:hypothetical protein
MTWHSPTRRPALRGRPHDTTLTSLSDKELEAELTIAAAAMGSRRWQRYESLLNERRRRRQPVAG